jgi:outer membrane protein OmpA-like peptidoglycan-associated protein
MSIGKILLGAAAAALLPVLLNKGLGWGTNCKTAAATTAVDTAASTPTAPLNTTAPVVPATAEAVKNCQADLDAIIKGKTINFETSRAVIAADSMPLIDELAKSAKDCAGTVITIAGHTDSRGNDAANLRLSEERANAVVAALSSKGVPTDRMKPIGYGETKPLDPALTQEAYTKNRRTELTVAAAGAAPAAENAATPAAGQ